MTAVRWTALSSIVQALIQMFQIAVLARILPPEDFGLMAMATVVIMAVQIVADPGIHNAIIHRQANCQDTLSSLYWLGVMTGTGAALIVLLLSPLAALWYGESRIAALLVCIAPSFAIAALGRQLRVVAQKELRFGEIARVELASALLGFLAAVGLALSGAGVYSLVGGMMASACVATALDWWLLAHGWRPLARFRLQDVREYLGFGLYSTLGNLAYRLHTQADLFIGGRLLPPMEMGLYTLPRGLCLQVQFVVSPIVSRVGFPVLALTQQNAVLRRDIYLKMLRMTTSVNFPVYVAIALFSDEIIAVIFGERWIDSVPLLRILALWGLVRSVGNSTGSLLLAVGRADLVFKWEVLSLLLLPSVVWMGGQGGSRGLAWSMLMVSVGIVIPMWYWMIRPTCGARLTEFMRALAVPLGLTVAAGGIAALVALLIESAVIRLFVGVGLGLVLYVGASRWLNRVWYEAMLELLGKHRL